MKYQFKTFKDKVKQYVLHELDNTRDIIIIVPDIKGLYAHIDMENTIKTSKIGQGRLHACYTVTVRGKIIIKEGNIPKE